MGRLIDILKLLLRKAPVIIASIILILGMVYAIINNDKELVKMITIAALSYLLGYSAGWSKWRTKHMK